MKKVLYSVVLAAMAMVASCQKEATPAVMGEDGFATVTFAVDVSRPGTKAAADGLTATKLWVGVYDVTAEPLFMSDLSQLGTLTLTGGHKDLSIPLAKGQKYQLVFWAEAPASSPYTVAIGPAGATVTATTTGAGSDEARDAFFASITTGIIGNDFSVPVLLKRAVAQVNVLSTDWAAATAAGVTYTGASMSIAGLPDTIDLLSGACSGSATYSFTTAAAPEENLGDRKWVAMNYVLAAQDQGPVDIDFVIDGTVNNTPRQWTYTAKDASVTRNHRTNIFGDIFTTGVINPATEPDYSFHSVAELCALATTEPAQLTGELDAKVTYVPTTGTAILMDDTGSILISKPNHGLKQGQVIADEITVTVSLYNEAANITDFDGVFTGEEETVEPEVVSLDNLSFATYSNAYVKVENVMVVAIDGIYLTVSSGSKHFYVMTSKDVQVGDILTLTGTVFKIDDKEQIFVWNSNDLVKIVPESFTLDKEGIWTAHDSSWDYNSGLKTIIAMDGSAWSAYNTSGFSGQTTIKMNKGKDAYIATPVLPGWNRITKLTILTSTSADGSHIKGDKSLDIYTWDGIEPDYLFFNCTTYTEGLIIDGNYTVLRISCNENNGGVTYIAGITVEYI